VQFAKNRAAFRHALHVTAASIGPILKSANKTNGFNMILARCRALGQRESRLRVLLRNAQDDRVRYRKRFQAS
jgi:hypothetical protein